MYFCLQKQLIFDCKEWQFPCHLIGDKGVNFHGVLKYFDENVNNQMAPIFYIFSAIWFHTWLIMGVSNESLAATKFPLIYIIILVKKKKRKSSNPLEFATSGPFFLKMWKKWIRATGEPWNCVKVGWKKVNLVFFSYFCFFSWLKYECWPLVENESTTKNGCKLNMLAVKQHLSSLLWCVSETIGFNFFLPIFFRQHKIDCGDIWQKITKCRK